MDISVVVPLYNEEESLPELFAWIERVMNANGFSYEVIFVNDGSTDRSWQVIEQLQAQAPDKVRGIKLGQTAGKSCDRMGTALWHGNGGKHACPSLRRSGQACLRADGATCGHPHRRIRQAHAASHRQQSAAERVPQ